LRDEPKERLRRRLVHIMSEEFENAAFFLRLDLPFTRTKKTELGVSKTLLKPEEFQNVGFAFWIGQKIF